MNTLSHHPKENHTVKQVGKVLARSRASGTRKKPPQSNTGAQITKDIRHD